ncbi:MAG: transposase [Mesorhizobium sp.]|nr:MAG: transposase [Mesorhizobium sp.]
MRLLPAHYVMHYLKRQKNDAADAEAICEAVTRPTMPFVPVKTPEQQSVMILHRVRLMLNRPADTDIERVASTSIQVRGRGADRAE